MSKQLTVVKEETLDAVAKRIKALQASGEIHFPPDYSPQNALKSAWLILQEIKDKDKNLALEVCTKASILNSLMDMVITGLNPAKKQGYFLAYGKQLAFQRSYFGSMALAKRVDPDIEDIIAEPVYEADELEYEIIKGRKQIIKHKQSIDAVNSKNVKAAYCMVIDKNGEVKKTDLMTFEEIKKSWKKSKMEPVNKDGTIKAGSTHDDYLAEMCRRTVINRTCKPIINSSDDKHLKIAAMRSEVVEAEEDALLQIEEHANQEVIDIDKETEEEQKTEKIEPIWDPYKSEIQQRYGTDKAKILKEECAARNINVAGLTPREAHEKLLKVVAKEAEQAQGQGETPKEQKANGNHWLFCPERKHRINIEVCENSCKEFQTCQIAQDKIAELMAQDQAGSQEQTGQAGAGPDF